MEERSAAKSADVGMPSIHLGLAVENEMWIGHGLSRSLYVSMSSDQDVFERLRNEQERSHMS